MNDFKDFTLSETNETRQVDSRQDNYFATLAMIDQGKQTLNIFSHDLDPYIYDQKNLVQAVKHLVINNRHSKVRILIADPARVIQRGNRLVDLAFDLSSYIELRKPGPDHKDFNEGLFIIDQTAYIHRKNINRYEATLNFNDRRQSKQLLSLFDGMWESAKPDPNLRRVTI